jgi:two-component system sensor histidine kinase AlgZ
MQALSQTQIKRKSPGVYPPTFCRLRLWLAVAVVTQLAVFMVALGRLQGVSLEWLLVASAYGQSLALVCAISVCIFRSWLARLSPRGAWVGSWLIIVIMAFSWSYVAGVIGTVLGLGPGRSGLNGFMLQSLLAASLVSIALLRYLFIRAQWRTQITAQAEARVQALQARIRPHFLFNSLNTISALIPDDPDGAESATMDLADLFRGSMRRADRSIRLAEELDLARKYIAMEQRRLGSRLQVEWKVDELPAEAEVPPMILQPLLENAVVHGIQHCEGGGTIHVFGRGEKDNIVVTLSNPVNLQQPAESGRHQGMALRNIRSRLELAFGDRASLVTLGDDHQFISVLTLPHVESTDR